MKNTQIVYLNKSKIDAFRTEKKNRIAAGIIYFQNQLFSCTVCSIGLFCDVLAMLNFDAVDLRQATSLS